MMPNSKNVWVRLLMPAGVKLPAAFEPTDAASSPALSRVSTQPLIWARPSLVCHRKWSRYFPRSADQR